MTDTEIRRFGHAVYGMTQRQPYPVMAYWSRRHGQAFKNLESRVQIHPGIVILGVYDAYCTAQQVSDDVRAYLGERVAA
jgi:hypothetical protein